jgi:plastocyanin
MTLGLVLGASLFSRAALGEPTDGKVKYLYKPVPCSPCPCECPAEPGGRAPTPRVFNAEPRDSDGEREPVRPAPTPRASSGGSSTASNPPSSEPREPAGVGSQVRGNLGGIVTLRDRSGKDKPDRSGVVVYIEQLPNKKFAALKKVRAMAQRDKSFAPSVIAITRGSTVDFPNEDKFFHNVFSLSEGNTFDLGLYRAGESKSVTFEKTGVVDVYCNIHPNMWAQILVLDNPFFTTAGKDGSFEIAKLPPGTYSVAAWVSGGEPVRQQIKIEPGKRVEVALAVREGTSSKPHLNKFNQPYERYK